MQRFLAITLSASMLAACSHMDGMAKHGHTPYADLAKIAKQQDAQYALLLTREGKLAVVNVNTGKLLQSSETQKTPPEEMEKNQMTDQTATHSPPISDAKFAEIKRKFERTIDVKVKQGSVCILFVDETFGMLMQSCSPTDPIWW